MDESSASSKDVFGLGLRNTLLASRRMNLSFNPEQPIPSRVIHRGMSSNDAGAGRRYNAVDVVNDDRNTSMERSNKKRGRPRKKDTDAPIALGMPNSSAAINSSGVGVKISSRESSMPTPQKKRLGRPPGARSKPQTQAIAGAGESDLTMHVLIVEAGKDVHKAIVSFVEKTLRSFCILTAHGEVSRGVLRPTSSSGPWAFQGRFKIIALTGTSLLLADYSGHCRREGSLNLVLSDNNGRVLGGEVAGDMEAASRVRVVMWSFIPSFSNPTILTSDPLPRLIQEIQAVRAMR